VVSNANELGNCSIPRVTSMDDQPLKLSPATVIVRLSVMALLADGAGAEDGVGAEDVGVGNVLVMLKSPSEDDGVKPVIDSTIREKSHLKLVAYIR
jgi:hypothetical protein